MELGQRSAYLAPTGVAVPLDSEHSHTGRPATLTRTHIKAAAIKSFAPTTLRTMVARMRAWRVACVHSDSAPCEDCRGLAPQKVQEKRMTGFWATNQSDERPEWGAVAVRHLRGRFRTAFRWWSASGKLPCRVRPNHMRLPIEQPANQDGCFIAREAK